MTNIDISKAEMVDVLEHIKQLYGHDFLMYSDASLKRRIIRFMGINGINNAFELKNRLINHTALFQDFINEIPVMHTEMFRDAGFYQSMQKLVYPYLATYPHPKIWHAACATGEEVYSNAILLSEFKLLERCKIYATDINRRGLDISKKGIYKESQLTEFEQNYKNATNKSNLNEYYSISQNNIKFNKELQKPMVFSFHNLVTDGSFNEFNLIICRNVLIYFNRDLQNKVFELLYNSLAPLGFLAIGTKESMYGSSLRSKYEIIDDDNKIFRKIA